MAFSSDLKSIRDAAGMTLEDLAGKTGMSMTSITRWENGLHPSPASVKRLSTALRAGLKSAVIKAQKALRSLDEGALDAE